MSSTEWKVPRAAQPKPEDYGFDLDRTLSSVVGLSAIVPSDAFTAETLGTERAGNGVLIGETGLVLTIGYLITEAESVWLSLNDGRVVPGDVLAIDQETGFGLVQALSRPNVPAMPFGRSAEAEIGDRVVVAGGGGRARSVAARIAAKQEFAGYWEYLLEEAIFTAPAHPNWGGTALIGDAGELLGIGSLQLQQERGGRSDQVNMVVPIDLLPPILDDLLTRGRRATPARPWLGFFAAEMENRVAIAGVASRGPAEKAGLQPGDILLAVAGEPAQDLASLFRLIWRCGEAGAEVPLRIMRGGRVADIAVHSTDRHLMLKKPRLH
jgi:S1-C subfamily serine protease